MAFSGAFEWRLPLLVRVWRAGVGLLEYRWAARGAIFFSDWRGLDAWNADAELMIIRACRWGVQLVRELCGRVSLVVQIVVDTLCMDVRPGVGGEDANCVFVS